VFLKSLLAGPAVAFHILQLRRNQWKTHRELEEIQWKKLKKIVHYAYDYIPYYRMLFRSAKFKPDDLKSRSDLRKIPTTTKMDVRRNFSNMIAKGVNPSNYLASFTSGSTGTPINVLIDKKASIYSTAIVAYCSIECGLDLNDKLVKIGNFLYRDIPWPNHISIPLPLESGELALTIHRLSRIMPDAIYSYPWTLNSLCNFQVLDFEPKIVFSHGATLTEHTRSILRSRLGVEINDTYGAIEFNRMAFECNEHTGLHMITDNSYMEFLENGNPVSPGETGEIVVTGLTNYAMPFIRYELGDLGIQSDESCSCVRSWPLIKSVEGRIFDVFTLESGRRIYPNFFRKARESQLSRNVFCISEWQIVQEKKNKILFKIVKGRNFDTKVIKNIKQGYENNFRKLNEDVIIEVQIVDEIPVERSSKKKLFLSKLN
jgi:phenylacetate-CoA ligase